MGDAGGHVLIIGSAEKPLVTPIGAIKNGGDFGIFMGFSAESILAVTFLYSLAY